MKKKKINRLFLLSIIFLTLSLFTGCFEVEYDVYEESFGNSTISDETYIETTSCDLLEYSDNFETTQEIDTDIGIEESITDNSEYSTITEISVEENTSGASIDVDGTYTTPEEVAEYIHTFGTLPSNFITKKEAKALGWDSSKGNLWDVADGKSIGGDYFGNYEELLPVADDREYTECDVNYNGGFRGSERVIFSNDGLIFYTNDHYKSFTQLY